MNRQQVTVSGIRGLVATGLVGLLAACGGSGGDDDGSFDSVVARGVITEFGSVVMHGVHYETEKSRIVSADDGSLIIENPSDEELRQYLALGMVVELKGSSMDDGSGVAGTISVDSELVGPIDSIDSALRIIEVNAQTVTVTDDTIIDDSIIEVACGCQIADDTPFGLLNRDLDSLLAGVAFVEINGFPTDGGLQATRIEDVDNRDRIIVEIRNAGEVEVKGLVKNRTDTQFEINDLTVFYDAGDLDDDFGAGGLQNDQFVEVKGTRIPATDEMNAIEIELEHGDLSDDDADTDRFEIEGVILQVIPDASGPGGVIVIGQNEIRVDDIGPFVGMENLRVEIKAMLLSDGSLAVSRLHDESEDTVRTEDVLDTGDGTDFTTRLGLNLTATGRTRLENEGITEFAGKRVEARGFPLDGEVLWTRIEVEADDDSDCRLRGPATDISPADSRFKIAGVTIDVSQVSDNNFEGANGLWIGRQQFFAQLDEGKLVQASADSSGCVTGTLTAREVEFQGAGVDDGGAGGGFDDVANDNEIVGLVSVGDVTDNSFVIGGRTITVDANTLIDDSMIEAVRGSEVATDLPFGQIDETLEDLLAATPLVEVQVDADDLALSIEDIEP